jgi:DNA polymerase III alpha subunit
MRLDKFSNPVFDSNDLFRALYQGVELSGDLYVDPDTDTKLLEQFSEVSIIPPLDEHQLSVEEFDEAMQSVWNMPSEYQNMDIESYLVQHSNKEHYERLMEELDEFKSRNMLNLLRWLKYFVDTCEKHNIVWGVGRGSSVASYVLYVIGVHSIDPIRYNLDWREFLR